MTEPTDAELDELRQANSGRLNFVTLSEFRTIARAVLAKWGSQPVGAQPAPQREAQEQAPEVLDIPDQCPYFGPSPHREVWLDGWYAARAAQKGKT